jgi:hypothetical protein
LYGMAAALNVVPHITVTVAITTRRNQILSAILLLLACCFQVEAVASGLDFSSHC